MKYQMGEILECKLVESDITWVLQYVGGSMKEYPTKDALLLEFHSPGGGWDSFEAAVRKDALMYTIGSFESPDYEIISHGVQDG